MATNTLDSIKEKYLDSTVSSDNQWSLKEIIAPDLVRKEYLPACRKRRRAAVQLCPLRSYSDLFTTQDSEKAIKKILIEGEAGIGKTTLCTMISRDWATGQLFQQFQLLLVLPIHEKKLSSATSVDALFGLVYDANTCTFIINFLEEHGEKVLIIVDGWDAVPSAPKQQNQCILYSILFGDRFRTISVLVTSRPSATLCTLKCFDQFIELRGFNKVAIKWSIQSYFPDKADNLLEQLETNPLIEDVCSIPLICAIICHMVESYEEFNEELNEEFDEEFTLPSTMTELHNELILHIINNSVEESNTCMTVSSLSDLPDDLKLPWQSLCEIAFQAIFPTVDEVQANSMNLSSLDIDRILKFGLVKSVSDQGDKTIFHFCLKAVEEYLAALHLVQQPQDTQLNIFHSCTSLKHLTMVWRYFFGAYFREIMAVDYDFIKQCIQILAAKHISGGEGYMFCHYSFEAGSKIVSDEVVKVFTTTKRQSPTNLPLMHFGNPRTAHDCAAILYFIANIEQKTCIEINFSNCLRDKQLGKLVDLLDNKQSIVQLKTLDLSDNQFTEKMVVDRFMKLGSIVRSIEKLIFRNCCIGEDGMDTVMAIITLHSQTLKFLDLSHNSVSLHSLSDVILSDNLSNLEILFLQGAIVEQEDISCLADFFDALISHCKYLRRLDLSSNNFGDPGNPALSSIISQITNICENFDLVLDRQYMSVVEKSFIEIMEESIRKKGTIDHTVAHGVIVGPGRSGKNSLMNRLLGKGPPPPGFQSCSTGVLECVRKIEVKKLCTAVSGFGLQWNELKYDEEAVELMTTTARSYNANLELIEQDSRQLTGDSNEASSSICELGNTSLSERTSHALTIAPKRVKQVKRVKDSSIKDKRRKQKKENLFVYSSNVRSTDIFKQALQLRRMDGLREQLESSWSLYLTNTGGQIEFQELLPLLVSGPSVFFITFPLHKELKDHYTVQYQYKDGSIQTYPSPSTLLDEILQTLATISTLNCEHLECQPATSSEHITSLRPKVFFVGTHKDLLPKPSREQIIEDIDNILQTCIKKTSLFYQGSIEYACPMKRLIFTVDNLAEDDDDFQEIRLALERTVERSNDFTIRCPSTWLVFSLILRAKDKFNQVLTYSECFKIAQSCGISDRTELNNALFFIHTRLGLLRYFSVDGLNSLVILDPQVLFDRITDLIVSTFIEEHAAAYEIEEFQSRGILSIATIQRLSQKSNSKSQIPLDWLLKLLNYLRIAAHFKDHTGDKYFFPSVVCHAPEQQTELPIFNDHSPLLIAFKTGFCPRGISGALIKYLMTNETNPQLNWELHFSRIYKNQVTFGIKTLGDIILKVHPTHLELQFDPQSDPSDLKSTCSEAFTQIKQGMKAIMNEQHYFFAFYCTRLECQSSPHPAKIEWRGSNPSKLKCHYTERKGNLPKGYKVWMTPGEQLNVCQVMSKDIGEIADNMWEWEGRIAEELGLTRPEIAEIKMKHDRELKLQVRAALDKWRQKNGSKATYDSLIGVFQRGCYFEYADVVKHIRDREMMIQQSNEVIDDYIPSSPPLPPQPSTYPKLQSPQFPATPASVEPFVLTNEARNSSESSILLECKRVCYLPMPSPFICDRTSLSLEHEEGMEIEFSHPSDEEMLSFDDATSQEDPNDPYELQKDTLYELHDQSSDQIMYKCSECHLDIENGYHCKECNDFDLCPVCYQSVGHEHPMDKLGLGLDNEASFLEGPKDPREQRKASIEKSLRYLEHATKCHDPHCEQPSCIKMKRVLTHTRECKLMLSNKWNICKICKQFVLLCISHAKNCNEDECPVPVCTRIKQNLRDQRNRQSVQRQRFLQLRMAQMSMTSQAASVQSANNSVASPATSPSNPTSHSSPSKDPPGSISANVLVQPPQYPNSVGNPMADPPGMQRKTSYPVPIPPIVSQPTQPWHDYVNPDLRQHLVWKLIEAIYPVHDPRALQDTRLPSLVQYAMKVEKVMFEAATDREEYYKLLASKIFYIRKELEDRKNQKKSGANKANSMVQPPQYPSSVGNPMAGPPIMQRKASYPLPIPPIVSQPTRWWHDQVNPDLRQHLVKKLVEAIYPVHDPLALQDTRLHSFVQYAMKVEKVMFEAATDKEEYYKLLARKIFYIRKELENRKNQKKPGANKGTVPSSSYTLTGTTGGGATTGSGAGQFINSLHSSGGLGQLASPSSSNATANFSPRPISVENSGSGGDMSSALNVPEMPPIPESIPIMPNTHTLVAAGAEGGSTIVGEQFNPT